MRAIPKSKVLASVEAVLLLAALSAAIFLWSRGRAPAVTVATGGTQPQPVRPPLPAARPAKPAAVPAVAQERAARRPDRPMSARTFDLLYDNPQANPLHLTADQIDALQESCNRLHEDRMEIEARFAVVEKVEGQGVFIEIPAYPQEGKALEQAFLSSLSEKFGDELAGAIETRYLDEIEWENERLGQMPQQYLASVDPDNPGRLKVVHNLASDDGTFRSTKNSAPSEYDFREYGPLAAYFPKP